jgi:hypothetical protein
VPQTGSRGGVGPETREQPEGDTDANQPQPARQDHPQDVALLAADREPNGDVARLLRDGIGQHAVDADGHEQQPRDREHAEDDQHEAGLA